jgi:membrane protein implicated in regulation of membrane protease activity
MPPQLRTGTDALIGERAVVLQRIANAEGVGAVKLAGEIWSARAYDEDEILEAGEKVQVIEIRGATALVTEV